MYRHAILFQFSFCGESGIRTHDTLLEYTHFPGVRLQPLGHLSEKPSLLTKNSRQKYILFKKIIAFRRQLS